MTYIPPTIRDDGIEIRIVDKVGTYYGSLDGASIKSVAWSLIQFGLGQIELDLSKVDPAALKTLLVQREIQVIFTNVTDSQTGVALCWWGVLAARKSKTNDPLAFICYDIPAWLKVRIVETATLTYTSIEQFDIAWNLITTAQTGTGYDLNITASYTASGYVRSRIYQRDQHKIIFDALTEFPGLNNGFDWDIVYDIAAGHRLWTPYYPQKGSVLAAPRFWYIKDGVGNIVDYEYEQNAFDSLTSKVYVTGGTANGVKFEQNYEDVPTKTTYGAMVRVVSDGSQNDVGWLLDEATKTINIKKYLPLSLKITVQELPANSGGQGGAAVLVLGKVHTGDTVQIDIDNDADQLHLSLRISSIKWNDNGLINIELIDPTTVQVN